MAYYSTHGIIQFLFNNEKQRVWFLLSHPVYSLFRSSVSADVSGELWSSWPDVYPEW